MNIEAIEQSHSVMNTTVSRTRFLLAVLLTTALDQLSKLVIVDRLQGGDPISIIPGFFNLVIAYNKGVAFGVFADIGHDGARYVVLAITTAIALGAVWYFARQEQCRSRTAQIALAMIVGGAFGNIIDRVRLGHVVDFLDVYYGSYHWPAFNLADSFICIGVGLLLFFTPATAETKKG